jgi:hypothetical protein
MNNAWWRWTGVVLLGPAVAGCGDRCADLQEVCDLCEDPNQKSTCELTVDSDDGDRCDRDVGNFCTVCGRRGTSVLEACK